MLERKAPAQSRRKGRWEKLARKPGSSRDGVEAASVVSPEAPVRPVYSGVAFPCPGCAAPIDARPDRFALRCPSCGALLRSRPAESSGPAPAFDVEVAGRPGTRLRVELPWDEAQRRRLSVWLVAAAAVTVALVLVLYVLARLLR